MSFKKGHSYIRINDIDNPKHVLIKALVKKGYLGFNLIFAPKWSNNVGWECEEGSEYGGIPLFLGYTKAEALIKIEKIKAFLQ